MKDYRRIGWRTYPKCQQRGFAYYRRGHYEVKHHPQYEEAHQLTFMDSGLQLVQKKQKTCYISRKEHHFAIVTTSDRRLKVNRPAPASRRLPPSKIAVFAHGVVVP
ncbi:MAG: hypothetical protein AB1753_06890 [Thermoproteota archaeon]